MNSCKFYMKIRPVTCGLMFFLVQAEQKVIWRIKDEEHLVRHFQSNGVDNPCINWVLPQTNLLLTKKNDVFYIL